MSTVKDSTVALEAAVAACAVAHRMQQHAQEERKADSSPVSAADRAADVLIRDQLSLAYPSDAILSEEAVDDGAWRVARRVWIIDPIDGTRAYLDGHDEWAVQIALWQDGALALGVVAMPNQLPLLGVPGAGAWRVDAAQRRRVQLPAAPDEVLLASRRLEGKLGVLGGRRLRHTSSVGGKIALLLDGAAWAYLQPQALAVWDVAAPLAIWLAAGGAASDAHGATLGWDPLPARVDGLVCAAPERLEELVDLAAAVAAADRVA